MSGELDTRPDLVEQIRVLRDKVRDLESRVSGDESGLDLSDLNDVRVDSIGDPGVTLVDGSALVYRASDDIWVAGTAAGGGGLPSSWVEYQVASPPQGAYAYNTSARTVLWADGSFSHGGAIIVNGSSQPEVTEDGWYVLDTFVLVEATTVGSVWTRALGILDVFRSYSSGGDSYDNVFLSQVFGPYVDNDGRWGGNASFSWTGYLLAGDHVRVRALLAADVDPSDTWRIAEAQFRMEKLPM